MNWYKLLRHDLHCGLFRLRYLLMPIIFLLPCFVCRLQLRGIGENGSVADYLLYCFSGSIPLGNVSIFEFRLPILWLLVIASCLFLNLDYCLNDLTLSGQQIILRSGTRMGWYFSKCVWNILSCVLYFTFAALTVLLFTLATGGETSLESTPVAMIILFEDVVSQPVALTSTQTLLIAVLLPCLTIAALSMLEMLLSLLVRPVISFLSCMCLLILALYWESPFALGNGAMTMRSRLLSTDGLAAGSVIAVCVIVLIICAIVGAIRFRHTDILGMEE